MKLVIIAGGKGTRLGKSDIPKPMVPVAGKPLLERQIELAARYGLKDITILSGHLSNVIVDYCGDGSRWGVTITHCVEQEARGTAGALKQIEGQLPDRFMVLYGDVVLDMDLERFMRYDAAAASIATLVVHPNDHPQDSDLLDVDQKMRITQFNPKPHPADACFRNLVNAGCYILDSKVLSYIPGDTASDFGKDIFPSLMKDGQVIRAYSTPEYIKDMGTPERLKKTESDILSGTVAARNFRNSRRCIFLDRDGVLNHDTGNVCRSKDLNLIEGAADAVHRINGAGFLAVVVTNQPVIAKGMCTESELREIHNKLETLLGRAGAYLDGLYYCPHHPDKGFAGERPEYKIACSCRKPGTGLIDAAVKDFNIDRKGSFLIGDRAADIEAGRRAGLTSVLVRTGYGGRDCTAASDPQYRFEDLAAAVDFILEQNSSGKECTR